VARQLLRKAEKKNQQGMPWVTGTVYNSANSWNLFQDIDRISSKVVMEKTREVYYCTVYTISYRKVGGL
jgi:hypothetical protein